MIRLSILSMITLAMIAGTALTLLAAKLPEVRFEKYKLPNGLEVILHEDHSTPLVSVNVWYHVGSKNEKPGRTGFAHLFEHMMFQGSKNHDDDYFTPLQKIGGALNGSTSEDRTNYWENVPSNYLELAIWLEADRMGFLLPAMTQKKLDNQRDVVKNERRQRLDNQPYVKSYELSLAMLYPKDHPYSWPVIGSMADLSAASIEDVSEFFRTYYAPNNASLCIAGDFKPEEVKQLIEKYFAAIPSGPPVDRLTSWVPRLDGVRRASAEDNVNLPRVYMIWHTPARYKPGDAEFDLISSVLGSGKTSRLYKSLVYEKQIAQDVTVYQQSNELGSTFNIEVTAREGHALDEIEKAVEAELSRLLTSGVAASELNEAQNEIEAQFVRALQQVGGFGGRADRLNLYNVFLGDPDGFQWDLDRYGKVTASDVLKYAKQYIDMDHRVVIHIVPMKETTEIKDTADRTLMPKPAAEPSFNPPSIQRTKLSNKLDVLLVEDHKLPLVQVDLVIKSGFAADSADRPGAASLTAELIDEGTKTRNALQIAKEEKALGATLQTGSFFDASTVELNVLKKNLDRGLNLMADVVLNPTFPNDELERQRAIYLGNIQQEAKDPAVSARKIFLRTLFGAEHPYGQPFTGSGTEASIKAIRQQDLTGFYKANYVPNNSAVVIAGDITLEEAKAKLEKAFQSWKPGEVAKHEVPDPPAMTGTKVYIVDKPGAAQSMIFMGNPGIRRNDPDYVACVVMNRALGGKFTSRINMNLREDKGYTYGARSGFMETRGVGGFLAYAPVQTQNTKESIFEFVKELREITTTRPLSAEELTDNVNNVIKGFPQSFETYGAIAGEMHELVMYGLPDDDWSRYLKQVSEVTREMTTKAAKDHIHPEYMLIVVVGDRQKIETGIKELNLGEIGYLDADKF